MKARNIDNMKAQGGFTLIEVIAVLVIVGMLAAVAIPKYLDMQTSAAKNAVQGALAAGASNVTMEYSQELLGGDFTTLGDLATCLQSGCTRPVSNSVVNAYTTVGDFNVTYAANGTTGIDVTLAANGAPAPIVGQLSKLSNSDKMKTVTLQ